jgi:hypothetical protein
MFVEEFRKRLTGASHSEPFILLPIDLDFQLFAFVCTQACNVIVEAAAPQYDWINRIIAVGVGHRLPATSSIASSRFSDGKTNKLSKRHPPALH